MSFKTKAIGLLAGSALALSLTTGAMAGDETASATLQNDTTENCYVSAATGTLALGTWVWNGTSYSAPASNGNVATVTVDVTQKISSGDWTCTVSATAGNLTQRDENGDPIVDGGTIPAANMTTEVNNGTAAITTPGGTTGVEDVPIKVTLSSVGNAPAGDYEGTITIDVTKAS